MRNTFRKKERISSKKLIQELFSESSSFYLHPFVIKHQPSEEPQHHRVLISVSKRKFKLAVDRNLIKRRIREAYRLNKHDLSILLHNNLSINIAIIYSSKDQISFELIEKKLILVFKRLVKELSDKNDSTQ